jgi:hypothetical protein
MKVHIGRYPKDSSKERKVSVRIDKWDTWNMDTTLAHIVLPMLKQLKQTKHGSPYVALDDVPEHLHPEIKSEDGTTDSTHFERWDYVMDEMIFAFESKLKDWEDQFWKVRPEIDFSDYLEDEGKDVTPLRWKVEGECDWEGMRAYQARITNGFRLFGKYYEGLWD